MILTTALAFLLAAPSCGPGNVAHAKHVAGVGVRGDPSRLTDGGMPEDGTVWNAPEAVILENERSTLVVDLGSETEVRALLLQADNDDVYHIEGSTDGARFGEIWVVPDLPGQAGLRTRGGRLPAPTFVRYLRVRASGGDGRYSVSELKAFCVVPHPPSPPPAAPAETPGWWGRLNDASMLEIKRAIAALATVLLLVSWVLERRGGAAGAVQGSRAKAPRLRRLGDALLLALAVVSLAAWWNLFRFHFDSYVHTWDTWHYDVGAKYFRELGYTGLYEATAAAEIELGLSDDVAARRLRNLVTNRLESTGRVLSDPRAPKARFSPERWASFLKDIAWFRGLMSRQRWAEMQEDHGYNATPVWGIAGSLLANLGPSEYTVPFLLLLDPLLLVLVWVAVFWAFDWRSASVAAIWWGTNYPARFWWNGGSFLRMDWLFFMVLGICLLRKARPAGAGFALAYAALLRIFPGFVLAGLVLRALVRMVTTRSLAPTSEEKRLAAGAALAIALLVPVATLVAGGVSCWPGFVENSRKHLATPLTNNMGLRTILSFTGRGRAVYTRDFHLEDPFGAWKEARLAAFASRRLVYAALLLGFVALLSRAVTKLETWEAAVLSAGLIFFAAELTCYYYSAFLVLGFLWRRRRLLGIGLLALSFATLVVPFELDWDDDRFTVISVLVLAYLVAATLLAVRPPEPEPVAPLGRAGSLVSSPRPKSKKRKQKRRT